MFWLLFMVKETQRTQIQPGAGTLIKQKKISKSCVFPSGVTMATDIVAQLADSLAKTGVEERELSYKGQGRKLDDAHSGESSVI